MCMVYYAVTVTIIAMTALLYILGALQPELLIMFMYEEGNII